MQHSCRQREADSVLLSEEQPGQTGRFSDHLPAQGRAHVSEGGLVSHHTESQLILAHVSLFSPSFLLFIYNFLSECSWHTIEY